MTLRHLISTWFSSITISLLLLLTASSSMQAQGLKLKMFRLEPDSIPMMRGFQVSFDLFGFCQRQLSDYGQYEGALRLNLHDQWFPIVEAGYGEGEHMNDQVTGLSYKTAAPYFRVGMDFNLLKKKHGPNRMYGGFRYAFTSYKVDLWRANYPDPTWLWDTSFGVVGEKCSQHWLEAVLGIDAEIVGPLHLGWSVRYKRRIAHQDGVIGKTWYVPGYGIWGDTRLGGTFNVIIDI
jgi:hypothetical protein